MKKNIGHILLFISSVCLGLVISSCNQPAKKYEKTAKPEHPLTKTFIKPPGSYNDTLEISYPAAVFYQPDSLQLLKIKAVADPGFYESSMHEYFYQMLTARIILKKTWPWLTIIESEKYRFLEFVHKNNTREYIDLDTKYDTHGLFVFDGKKPPLMVDMTNADTEISFYLKK